MTDRASHPPSECPILRDMREAAMLHLRKRDRIALEQIDLAGTMDEASEFPRAQIWFEAFFPGAAVKPHPGGAKSALMVAGVPFIGHPTALPTTSAARRKLFIAAIEKAMSL